MRISLDQDAIKNVKALFSEHKLEGHFVRIGLSEDKSYTLDIVDETNDRDRTFEFEGVKLVCDPRTWLYLAKDTKVGFSESEGGFTFSPTSIAG
jgi:Fe-S cluster assembly iron-binding protein IscA